MSVKYGEKELIKRILAGKKIFAATYASIFVARNGVWAALHENNIFVLLLDQERNDALFLCLLSLTRMAVLWEHEIYFEMALYEDTDGFLSFESDTAFVGVLFAEKNNCTQFLSAIRKRMEEFYDTAPVSEQNTLSLDDIGDPEHFQHLAHVGFNEKIGCFDIRNIPPGWKTILQAAGVTSEDMKHKEVVDAVVEIINENTQAEEPGKSLGTKEQRRVPPPPPPRTPRQAPPRPQPTQQTDPTPQRQHLMEEIRSAKVELNRVEQQPRKKQTENEIVERLRAALEAKRKDGLSD
ncbi:MAG: putative WASP family actin assembly factor [Amphiamblys sp. WSBS2006]|nr:MAG: putative WASP family actin assembly factor [Amphiamblys sp. WSBS2006]